VLSQRRRPNPSFPNTFRKHGIGNVGAPAGAWRHKLGNNFVAIGHKDDFSSRCQADIFTQPVFEHL